MRDIGDEWMSQQQLHQLIIKQLLLDWQQLNSRLFLHQMNIPQFQLLDSDRDLGKWSPSTRVLSIQMKVATQASWLDVLEVLKHEMAHQFVSEILNIKDEDPHGPMFQKVCQERGIDGRSYGRISLTYVESIEDKEVFNLQNEVHTTENKANETLDNHKILDKVRKLLSLAQSDNLNEAEQAAMRAQTLIVKHQLERYQQSHLDTPIEYRQLGMIKSKHFIYEYAITQILIDYFFVDVIWIPNCLDQTTQKIGSVAEMIGSFENLEIAEYVYHFLLENTEKLWLKHQKANQLKGLKEKLSFKYGVIKGFENQLKSQKQVHINEMGLIYLKDPQIQAYLEKRHKYLSSHKNSWNPTQTFLAGKAEGEQLRLQKGIQSQNSTLNPQSNSNNHQPLKQLNHSK
jgi:hypothetical protein